MKKAIVFFLLLSLSQTIFAAKSDGSTSLTTLDEVIKERPIFLHLKEQRISELRRELVAEMSDDKRYHTLGLLLEEYRNFNTDTALYVAQEREKMALKIGDPTYVANARMNISDVMGTVGLYKEALDILKDIHIAQLPSYLHSYYYHIYRTVYGLMADYSVTEQEKKFYEDLTDRYRDSLLIVNNDNPLIHTLIQSDQYNAHNDYDKAIKLLTDYLTNQKDSVHNVAICAYTLSEAYRLKGDTQKEEEYLIISSIADMKSAIREYIALRKLAVLLYYEGDLERAYSYIKICMEDAATCNARLRMLEILEIFPIINEAYRQKSEEHQAQMRWALAIISLLSLFLVGLVFYVYKQMKRLAMTRREVVQANRHLKELNDELHSTNTQLIEANHSIAENSYLKEEYIGRYMDQCSVYLEKMDNYRRSLGKIASKGNMEELYKNIRSSKFIEEELREFYANFDDTFLHLFPTFVEDFNSLLAEGEKISLKANERMSAELRIFALIRLGITDSVKIAQFLRYSVTTIYNYRTKMRNKAVGDRDQLENEVMKIGKSKD